MVEFVARELSPPALPGHRIAVQLVEIVEDRVAVHYTIAPRLPDTDGEQQVLLLETEAVDDLGNEYLDYGGAYGPAPDGSDLTCGSVSVRGPVNPRASQLVIRFSPRTNEGDLWEVAGVEVTVKLDGRRTGQRAL